MIKWLRLRSVVFAGALFAFGLAQGANLLWNGNFTVDSSGWPVQTPEVSSAQWNPNGAPGSPGSGSIRVSNFDPGSGQGHGIAQCVSPITPGATYTYRGKVRFPTGQTRAGVADIGVTFFSGLGCTGSSVSTARTSKSTPEDAFVSLQDTVKAKDTANSLAFVAYPSTRSAGANELVAFFDDLVLDDGLPEPPANYQGLWWNAPGSSESGWGVNLAHQGDVIFATWFTYGLDGKPLWLAVVANKVASGVYTGDLFTTTGPPFNAVPWQPPVVETTVGTATFTFIDNNLGTFAYTVTPVAPAKAAIAQTKNITRQIFATPVPHCTWNSLGDLRLATNYQDLWWASPPGSESGWGINLTHQENIIFATWFTYDANGQPLWLAAVFRRPDPGEPNLYTGDVFTTTGPPFNAVPFDPSTVVETVVGEASITFTDGNTASFFYEVNGIEQTKTITRQVFAGNGTPCK